MGGVELRFTLRAHRVDRRNRRVLAWREFDPRIAAPSEEPSRKHNP